MGRLALAGLALCACISSVQARPPADEKMNGDILQRQDLPYRFEQQRLDSADGLRHYRLWVGIPKRPAPASGYRVAYLLDGNAAVGALDDALLTALDQGSPPLLVAIGTDTPLRIDRSARTLDYTPRREAAVQLDPLTNEPSGGADAFLDLLQQRIKPLVASHYRVDAQRQTLWGHSYGGLLVLHALLSRPGEYQHYAAASPSLWWGDGAILEEQKGFATRLRGQPLSLLLMRGEQEPAVPGRAAASRVDESSAAQLTEALAHNPSLQVQYQVFPGLGHGPMLAESLRYTLQWLARQP
ncbi:ferric enterobactin esterase PfeE [Pseudomonas sp. 3A(2025)]